MHHPHSFDLDLYQQIPYFCDLISTDYLLVWFLINECKTRSKLITVSFPNNSFWKTQCIFVVQASDIQVDQICMRNYFVEFIFHTIKLKKKINDYTDHYYALKRDRD